MEQSVWGIHSVNDRLFLDKSIIAVGWKRMGDLRRIDGNREAFKREYESCFTNCKKGGVAASAGMLYRFVHEARVGDYVVFPSRSDRQVNIGRIESEYYFADGEPEYVNRRRVRWLKHLPRTAFSQGALYELGSAMSFFSVKTYADEYLSALREEPPLFDEETEKATVSAAAEDLLETTKDFILKELSRNYKGYELEDFVADLLNAMGYRAVVSPHGGDSGIDITAYRDELPPRILVQVKSRDAKVNESTLQSLRGAMHEGDYGLFVTLSDYTKNARRYLDNTPILRGINGAELCELILRYYDGLSETHRRAIPLRMVYIPVAGE